MTDKPHPTPLALAFEGKPITAIEYAGEPVVVASQLAAALGYTKASQLAENIAEKWREDFVEGRDYVKLTNGKLAALKDAVAKQPPIQGLVDARASHLILVTESGAQLAAMLARTPQGRAFRRWIVDEMIPAWRRMKELAPSLPMETAPGGPPRLPPAPPLAPPASPPLPPRRPHSRAELDRAELRLARALDALRQHGARLGPRAQEALAAELHRMAEAGDKCLASGHEEKLAELRMLATALSNVGIATLVPNGTTMIFNEAERQREELPPRQREVRDLTARAIDVAFAIDPDTEVGAAWLARELQELLTRATAARVDLPRPRRIEGPRA